MVKDFIENELKKFNITDAEISKASNECMKLAVTSVDDITNYNIVRQARIGIKSKRIEVEKKRRELKADSLAYSRAVDAEAKRIFALLAPIEDYLVSQENIVEDEKKRIKEAKERLEREEAERAEREERERIETQQRVEHERLEKQRIEQEAKEKELKEKQDKIDAENRRIAEERARAEAEERRKKEIAEAEERAKREAEEQAKREIENKRLKEEQEKREEELRIAQLPDRERIVLYAEALKAVKLPAISNTKMQEKFAIGKAMVIEAYKYFKSI